MARRWRGAAIDAIYQALAEAERSGTPAAVVTVIGASGSVPRHVGAKMLVRADGSVIGTVGGGELESRALAAARESLATGRPARLRYQLAEPAEGDPGVCGGEVELFVEPVQPPPAVFIIGCGHVGKAVAHLARWLGFRVVVTDDRAELCSPDWIPSADVYLPGALEGQLDRATLTASTYVVAVTRGYPLDVRALPRLLATPVPYIGVIGSRRRWLTTRAELLAGGVRAEGLARVHAPIGLELGAETPEEIAVSIMGEIIALRRGGPGQPMGESADETTDEHS